MNGTREDLTSEILRALRDILIPEITVERDPKVPNKVDIAVRYPEPSEVETELLERLRKLFD
jgi:hypothetical protein